MRETLIALAIVTGYVGLLVAVALWAERAEARGRRVASNPLVYALSLGVYASTWTFYGSVGFASRTGLLFLTTYLGPTLAAAVSWGVLRKLVRLKEAHRITSLPDLVSLRFRKSQAVALLATAILVVGLVPYLALQLKTMIATLGIVAGHGSPGVDLAYPAAGRRLGPPLVGLMLLFTIAFGLRRVRPTERHPGLVVALAAESIVKLVAFLAVGAFVTWGLFGGARDLFAAASAPGVPVPDLLGGGGVATWLAHLLLSAFAVLLLPRQFHLAVVENSDEGHVRTAMWLFPAYLLAINVFVLPLALGGLVLRGSAAQADTFVLMLPLAAGQRALSWLVFLGGFSAGTGMVVAETTALATMISNHVIVPAAEAWHRLGPLRRHVLLVRWVGAALVLLAAFAYERGFGAGYSLASIGFISFAAVLQLAPALLGGLFWRGASRAGALAGMTAGFATWTYTLVVPVLARSGWLPPSLVTDGPFGLELFAPEGLLAIHTDAVTHAVLWTLLLNVGAFVAGSLLFPPAAGDASSTEVGAAPRAPLPEELEGAPIAAAEEKRARATSLFAAYHGKAAAAELAERCLARAGVRPGRDLTALQLADFQAQVESVLAAAIGSAAAHAAVRRARLVTPDEARAISAAYAEILAALDVPPEELRRKIDYHRERERLLARDAANQRFLAGVGVLVGGTLDLDAVARTAVRLPVPHLADVALLALAPSVRGTWRAWFAHRSASREAAGRAALERLGAAIGDCPAVARALEDLRPALVEHPVDAGGWPEGLRALLPTGASTTLPLVAHRDPLGTLTLFAADAGRLLAPDALGLAEELARRLAVAVENARMYRASEDAVRARDEFLAVASHELKSPLTPLRLRIQTIERLLARGELASVPQERLLQLFQGADLQVARLAGLVDDLLDVTRITTRRLRLKPEPVDLAAAVRAVVERHRAELAAAGSTVVVQAPPGIVGGWDRMRVEQVLTNLLTNAAKYAPRSKVAVSVSRDGPWARVVVQDEGPGIPPADRERIFRPFERGSGAGEVAGLGLGLFIVREIVEAHAGRIAVESAPGAGTAFTVELPLDGAAASAGP